MQHFYVEVGKKVSIILATIFAHVISDFIIQSDKTVKEKSGFMLKGLLKHFFEVFIPLFIVLQLQFKFTDIIIYSLLMSATHIIFDVVKVILQRRNIDKLNSILFIMDQLLHIVFVIFVIVVLNIRFDYNDYSANIVPVFKNVLLNNSQLSIHMIIARVEFYCIIYILFGVGAGIFIWNFIKPFKPENQDEKSSNAGKYIGIFERFIIITLTILSQYSAIAFIVAAKSLARHEDLNKRGFAEYYLLGTLLSIFTAIIGGLLLNYIIPFI